MEKFTGNQLTHRIASIESGFRGRGGDECRFANQKEGINSVLFRSALSFKQAAGQINVVVHAVGILLSLPYILEQNESIQTLSLGAGNTGKGFDLETNLRVAEFKFIDWKGADSVRENSLFKDFYRLAEDDTMRKHELYVIRDRFPLKFLNGGRALKSVMSRHTLWTEFQKRYEKRFSTVGEYYAHRKDRVTVRDLMKIVPHFVDGVFPVEACLE